ncbi:MAG: cupin domain-containing protein [Burkholderiales bacterium]
MQENGPAKLALGGLSEFGPHQHKYFQVLSGRCRVTDDTGLSKEYGPGDSFIGGLRGTFEVLEPILKRYMIVDRPS